MRTSLGLRAMYWTVSCGTNGFKLHGPAAKCSAVMGVCMASIIVPGSLPAEDPFVARTLTAEHSFTAEIEGPACDRAGNIFAVSFARKPTIGRISPDGKGEVFIEFTNGSLANGIRFDRAGIMDVADYTNHNVLRIDPKAKAVSVFAHSDQMNQPNDVAITADGPDFASAPNSERTTGEMWRVNGEGGRTGIATDMGTTHAV